MNNGPYIPERGAGLTPQDFPNLPSGPALGFNSCSLCGHGGTSGSILARIREYVTFYANSDADLSDDMAIGRQEVSKSVMEILNEAEPVPAHRPASVPVLETPPPPEFDDDGTRRPPPMSALLGTVPCKHEWTNHNVPGMSERESWTTKGYEHCPDCGKKLGAPVEPVPAPRLEPKTIVRPDDDGTPDDIVIDDVKLFRMERMDDNAWWIGLYFEDTPSGAPDRICFWVGAKRAKVDVSVTEESHARPITDDTSLAAPPVGEGE
jgi:hypothetical protein